MKTSNIGKVSFDDLLITTLPKQKLIGALMTILNAKVDHKTMI